jgi:energy-coupling factor transporter transmembrane protein EcfT
MSASASPLPGARPPLPGFSLHLSIKVILLLAYITLLLLARQPIPLLLYTALALLGTIGIRLPLRSWVVPLLAALALLAALLQPAGLLQIALLGAGRLLCLLQLLTLFGTITQTTELLQALTLLANRLPALHALLYVLSSTLAVLPSIRQDVRKSMDVAILRKGSRATLLSIGTWSTILTDLLVRAMLRGQRLAEAVADRGYRLSVGLTPLPSQRFRLFDLMIGLALLLPGLAIFEVLR